MTDRPFTATSGWLLVKWRHFRVTSDHVRSRDVISCHVTALAASYSPVRAQTYPKLDIYAFYSHFQVTSGQMKSLLDHFRSRDVISCHVSATSCELQPCASSNVLKTWLIGLLQPLGEFRSMTSLRVASSHIRSSDVISCHVTATSCELQLCRSSNIPKVRLIGPLQPLPGYLRWNDVTSGSLPVTWGHVMSFPAMSLSTPASYSPVVAETYPKLNLQAFYSYFWPFRSNDITSGSFRSRQVTWRYSCHVTATSCELQPCGSLNVPKTWLIGHLQPLPRSGWMTSLQGHFWSREVRRRNFLSRDCHLLRVTALCELKHNQNLTYRPSTATSRLHPVKWRHFQSHEVSWRHLLSRDCHLLRVAALCELKRTQNLTFRPSTTTSRWLLVKGRHLRITSGHVRSGDVIFCYVTETSSELQPCASWNAPKTWPIGLLQPLPGDFRSKDVTSGSLPVTWGQVTSFPVVWPPLPASYSSVGAQTYQNLTYRPFTAASRRLPVKWRHFRVTSSHVTSRDVIFCHVTATSCELLPCGSSNVPKTWLLDHLQPLPGAFRWNDITSGHVRSRDVISHHVTATSCELQPCASWNVPKSWLTGLLQQFLGDFRWNEDTSRSLLVTRSHDVLFCHVTSHEVTWRHFLHVTATSCELQTCASSNVVKTWLIGLLQPLPGDFRSNDVTSGSLPVTWGHITSFPATWLPPPVSYSPVRAQTYPNINL